jgi:S-adenosylmethionine uptake transporter
MMKILGDKFNFIEISFFRFLFSMLTVFIIMFFYYPKKNLFRTTSHKIHAIRGIIGSVAVALSCLGVNILPMAENTTILFMEAIFMLPLAVIFLKEKISKKSIIALIVGFIGLIVILKPSMGQIINIKALVPAFAALFFALLSISSKKLVNEQENSLTMLFYFSLYSLIISAIFLPIGWKTPSINDIIVMFFLGVGANLLQLFLYIAFKMADASQLSPIRYVELPFAITLGYLVFGQVPNLTTIVGSILIIGSTMLCSTDST